jgi:soluble lytic murein transglycosylase
MMMRNCLVRAIPARWGNFPWRNAAAAVAAVTAIASTCNAVTGDPLADLKSGAASLESERYPAAIRSLDTLAKRLPKLADYAGWLLASAQFESKNYPEAVKALEPVWAQVPPSPLVARSAILAARAYLLNGQTKEALDLLRKYYKILSQPQGDLAMANALAAADDLVNAAVYYQHVYYGFPTQTEAAQAEAEIVKLREKLGDRYPPALPSATLGRAQKLADLGQTQRARKEFESLIPELGGADRDLARVSLGVADYSAKTTIAAHRYLSTLEVASPEQDAERLYYLLLCARRLNNPDEVTTIVDKLARLYPNSKWRMQALVAAASQYLVENQMDSYEPLYRACYESFPKDPQAVDCHWKVTWGHYLRRRDDAADLLRAHLRLFPGSENASAALYFLGRLSEGAHDSSAAFAYYSEITREYPNYYYCILARDRLAQLGSGQPSPSTLEFLRSVAFPSRLRILSFEANVTAQARIDRARLLVSAGLPDWAEVELRYGAQNEDQPHVLAIELASLQSASAPDQAMRYIKRYAPGYLSMPIGSAPLSFWKLAFPLPYRTDLERFAKLNQLDPFLMAALIRQESEFNPKAVSPANARGLAQIMPTTGRELSRRLKVTPYSTARLFQPVVSLELGTFYLKSIADRLGGRYEAALAAYNAGLTRANAWLTWADFREPAEFIETVPFAQTRNYIQTVLRNADAYRRIYGVQMQASLDKQESTK